MIYCISDLHLGDRGPRDNFTGREKSFNDFLDHVKDNELFILGDLFEGWELNIGDSIANNREIFRRFTSMNSTYVTGNHDNQVKPLVSSGLLDHTFFLDRTKDPFTKVIAGRRFFFCHGHEFDVSNKSAYPGTGEILSIATAMYKDILKGPKLDDGRYIDEVLVRYAEKFLKYWNFFAKLFTPLPKISQKIHLTKLESGTRAGQNLEEMYQFITDNNYDVIVAGHLHRIGFYEDWYVNTGSWFDVNNEYVTISDTGTIALNKWENGPVILEEKGIQLCNMKLAKSLY